MGAKLCVVFLFLFNFDRNYYVIKSKSQCILLNININFKKNETESKIEHPTHSFRETNLVLQSIKIKNKTVMSWSSRNKTRAFFLPFILFKGHFFNTWFLSHWKHFQNIHTFAYQKALLHTLFALLLAKAFRLSLSKLSC